jgi:hypothetical protein
VRLLVREKVLAGIRDQDGPALRRQALAGALRIRDALVESALSGGARLHLDTVVLCELVWVLRAAYQLERATVAAALLKLLDAIQLHSMTATC